MITAVIFDMDGVIVDSQSVLDVLEVDYFAKVTENKWTAKDQPKLHGKTIESVYDLFKDLFNIRVPRKQFLSEYTSVLEKTYRYECMINPGLEGLLKRIHSRKLKVAIASSTPRKYIEYVLDRFQIRGYFNTIVSSADVNGKSKPEPDIFLLAAKNLKTNPNNCLVIEDSDNGIKAAKRAGMYCLEYRDKQRDAHPFADASTATFQALNLNALNTKLTTIRSDIEIISIKNRTVYFQLSDKVNKSDYYSDFLLQKLLSLVSKRKEKSLNLLELGTGRGYIPIVLAATFPNISKIIGVDIDKDAVKLAQKNVWLNDFVDRIVIRQGNLYSHIRKGEVFDFIFGAPPQIPVTKKEMQSILRNHPMLSLYHLTTSAGGRDGQYLIRRIIAGAMPYLKHGGTILEVQADFSFSVALRQFAIQHSFLIKDIFKKKKLLSETSLTKLLEDHFRRRGYIFKLNEAGGKYFELYCVMFQIKK